MASKNRFDRVIDRVASRINETRTEHKGLKLGEKRMTASDKANNPIAQLYRQLGIKPEHIRGPNQRATIKPERLQGR